MMKIKCWISGSSSGSGGAASASKKNPVVIKKSPSPSDPTSEELEEAAIAPTISPSSLNFVGGGPGVVPKVRPTSLNVNHNYNVVDLKKFLRDAFNPWRSRETCGVVPIQQIRELFNEFNFSPTERQVADMLQTAKQFRRYRLDGGKTHLEGLTFGEFCILLADLRGFRTCSAGIPLAAASSSTVNAETLGKAVAGEHHNHYHDSKSSEHGGKGSLVTGRKEDDGQSVIKAAKAAYEQKVKASGLPGTAVTANKVHLKLGRSTATTEEKNKLQNGATQDRLSETMTSENEVTSSVDDDRTESENKGALGDGPEVFLGGSCNPTTWRADVAIPTLNKLGISFYNPQVSDWTPDLIELEHRAKEKARVLFFVMDSETRATAGAIEAAHIAGSNTKQLVLVLHPYKPNQKILNETVSKQEFIDLTRNQNLLRLLVIRRGLPITDSIPSGLQRIKAILSGLEGRSLPSNIASRLISVRRAFDRLVGKSADEITIAECQIALSYLGYTHSILSEDNIKKILQVHRDISMLTNSSAATTPNSVRGHHTYGLIFKRQSSHSNVHKCNSTEKVRTGNNPTINFEEFCVISAYLSVLQQELNENTCVSPIKGTNLPPPPIFLTNAPEWIHNRTTSFMESTMTATTISPTEEGVTIRQKQFYNLRLKSSVSRESRKRDSGTSSPLPQDSRGDPHLDSMGLAGSSSSGSNCARTAASSGSSVHRQLSTHRMTTTTTIPNRNSHPLNEEEIDDDDDDDSNDSVFSEDDSSTSSDTSLEMRDIYLGGSCMRRTTWRQDYVIPHLKANSISYHNPDEFDWTLSMGDIQYMNEVAAKTEAHVVAEEEQQGQKSVEEEEAEQLRQVLDEPVFNPALLDASRVLLFVITNETRSLAPMTLAAHYIGLGYDVVLCVQMLTDSIIGNEQLTQTAIKDYNRGRQYLMDLAKRQRIPVYDDIQAATECAVEKANMHKSIASI